MKHKKLALALFTTCSLVSTAFGMQEKPLANLRNQAVIDARQCVENNDCSSCSTAYKSLNIYLGATEKYLNTPPSCGFFDWLRGRQIHKHDINTRENERIVRLIKTDFDQEHFSNGVLRKLYCPCNLHDAKEEATKNLLSITPVGPIPVEDSFHVEHPYILSIRK